jgi:hypothetical protein
VEQQQPIAKSKNRSQVQKIQSLGVVASTFPADKMRDKRPVVRGRERHSSQSRDQLSKSDNATASLKKRQVESAFGMRAVAAI